MRATANPGTLDVDQHEIAVKTELKPQAASILSPEFAARLAAAKSK
jgi:enoyl-CoA hydratase